MEGDRRELEDLRAQLRRRESEAAEQELRLEHSAAELREAVENERARTQELRDSYVATVRALANAVEARDAYTHQHAERVAAYGLRIAEAHGTRMAENPQVEFGFLLHDVGKVAIPDGILFKPEPLDAGERSLMERHVEIGWDILRGVDWLGEAKLVVRHHHERWDGEGYPDGLAGEAIPLPARIFAVADTLDALTTDRPYRPGATFGAARDIIAEGAGTQFDPAVVEALVRVPDAVLGRARRELS